MWPGFGLLLQPCTLQIAYYDEKPLNISVCSQINNHRHKNPDSTAGETGYISNPLLTTPALRLYFHARFTLKTPKPMPAARIYDSM